VEAWLSTVTRSRALDRLRRRAHRREESVENARERRDMPPVIERLAVREALRGLSEVQRRALELAYYEGLTQVEIAETLGEPLGTIKTRIRSAMSRLRATLDPLPGAVAGRARSFSSAVGRESIAVA
jgi:RNA polymerase sigma-70 factor (ECF subfamily)